MKLTTIAILIALTVALCGCPPPGPSWSNDTHAAKCDLMWSSGQFAIWITTDTTPVVDPSGVTRVAVKGVRRGTDVVRPGDQVTILPNGGFFAEHAPAAGAER